LTTDKPSIAVLPFANMCRESEQAYFSDGLTMDLITDLCKCANLSVKSVNSVYAYKNKTVGIQRIGREMNVQYVLEGSVRMCGQKLRITTQLVDAASGGPVWAERYDMKWRDPFDIQDELSNKIVPVLNDKMTMKEMRQ